MDRVSTASALFATHARCASAERSGQHRCDREQPLFVRLGEAVATHGDRTPREITAITSSEAPPLSANVPHGALRHFA